MAEIVFRGVKCAAFPNLEQALGCSGSVAAEGVGKGKDAQQLPATRSGPPRLMALGRLPQIGNRKV
jgi:hypothetical protein